MKTRSAWTCSAVFGLLMTGSGCLSEPALVGLSCSEDGRCPNGLVCVDGRCATTDTPGLPGRDAGPDVDPTVDGGPGSAPQPDAGFEPDVGPVDGGLPSAARCVEPVEYPTSGWQGRYFALLPSQTFGPCIGVIDDARDDVRPIWSGGGPFPGAPEQFGSSWTARRTLEAGAITFSLRFRDGIRIYLDDRLMYEVWGEEPEDDNAVWTTPYLAAGTYDFRIEHFSEGRLPRLSARWNRGCQLAVSRQDLGDAWVVSYHRLLANNRIALDECFGWERIESVAFDMDWGRSAPGPVAAAQVTDEWALIARADRELGGEVDVSVTTDDGVRIYLDDDDFERWTDGPVSTDTFSVFAPGRTRVVLEKYDRTGEARLTFGWGAECGEMPTLAEDEWWATYYGLIGNPTTGYQLDRSNCLGAEIVPGRTLDIISAPVIVLLQRPLGLWGAEYRGTRTFAADDPRVSMAYEDGIRLYSGARLIYEDWMAPNPVQDAEADLEPGTHALRVEYLQEFVATLLRLEW